MWSALLLMLAACVPDPPRAAVQELPRLFELPDFQLTERGGRTVTKKDLLGRIWVADFIFTRCQGPCPAMTREMHGLQETLGAGEFPDLRLVTITVDPLYDTPAVLTEYARAQGAEGERWLFLTGEWPMIHKLAGVDGFKLPVQVDQADGLITHSTRFALVDDKGWVRGYYEGVDGPRIDDLKAAVRLLRTASL